MTKRPTRNGDKTTRRSPRGAAAKTVAGATPAPAADAPSTRVGRGAEVKDAALALFSKFGYHGASMKDIAAALRMRAPSLYNHVAAKQDLLREIVVTTHEGADRELRAAIKSSTDVAEQLRRATEVHVRFHTRHPREWRVASRDLEHLEEPARTEIRKMRRSFEDLVVAIIERGVAEKRFHVTSARLTALAIFRMSAGVGQWYRPGGEFSEGEIAFCFGDLALRMVGLQGSQPPVATKPKAKAKKAKAT